ncbi:trophoblast glycoprotein b [Erpetoichthys calabaricus]|uniref:trophoblast glycoprotein b n=1 Tax=Erpetoichthys calabaricus TaxID=27687 RepID=UPI002234A82D|nr:trophoblast glycoprotein b [Erpetoichthys calabaricus]XP_028653493.2 trophoblast glycoprotein b [Erpetoichthys calabaricus]
MSIAGPLFCVAVGLKPGKRLHPPAALLAFLGILRLLSAQTITCPQSCECSSPGNRVIVKCLSQNLTDVPKDIPPSVKILFVTGNFIQELRSNSFPEPLDQLVNLNFSSNRITSIDPQVFAKMPNLKVLDLSHNQILTFSPEAFGANNSVRELNLSSAMANSSVMPDLYALLQNGSLANLVSLDLSDNQLSFLPGDTFSGLVNLKSLDLRNNSLVSLRKDTFRNLSLHQLDLRSNALKTLCNSTLHSLDTQPDIQVQLLDNSWICDCNIEDFVAWLRRTDIVVDGTSLSCAFPDPLRRIPLVNVDLSQVDCNYEDMKRVLQTSYVFLGIVLALIGVIFLLVLYLNRKGIKKWLYNIRDACRDHMEGYHYRYEINTDPRLTNLSLNSDV